MILALTFGEHNYSPVGNICQEMVACTYIIRKCYIMCLFYFTYVKTQSLEEVGDLSLLQYKNICDRTSKSQEWNVYHAGKNKTMPSVLISILLPFIKRAWYIASLDKKAHTNSVMLSPLAMSNLNVKKTSYVIFIIKERRLGAGGSSLLRGSSHGCFRNIKEAAFREGNDAVSSCL